MRKLIALGFVFLSLATVSCRRGSMESTRPMDVVKFSVVMNGYESKATDNALEAGDAVGIFAGEPIGAANVKAKVSGSALEAETPLYWAENQKESTEFAAYLPYDASLTSATTSFSVQADQTSFSAYQASDLIVGIATAAPRTTVAFGMKHQLSKLTVVATCEDTEESVSSVTIQELVSEATADLAARTVAPGSAKSAIKAGQAVAANGGRGYVAILVPQTVQLKLTIATSKGRSLEYALSEPEVLASGTAYLATVNIPREGDVVPAAPVEFTIGIVDWGTPEDLTFLGDDDYNEFSDGKWSVVGLGGDWDSDLWMVETSEGVWELDITYHSGDKFKLRRDGKWSTDTESHPEAGMPGDATEAVPSDGSEYGLWAVDNQDIYLSGSGVYHLKFIPEGYLFYVTLVSGADPEITELYLLGGATDTGWSLNDMPQLEKNGNLFSITANLKADQKFRFPMQREPNVWWPCLVRGDTEGTVKIGTSDDNDDDQFTVSQDGSYEIIINVSAMTISLTRKGDRVEPEVEITELYLLGGATDTGWSLDDMAQLERSGNVFTITAHLVAGTIGTNEVFRFPMQRKANVWWPCLVKGATDDTLAVGTSDADQSRQFTVDTSGTYLITIDVSAMTISIVLQTAD